MAKLVKKKAEETAEPVNFLRKLLSTISHKTGLSFGVNDNCRLIKVDNTERKREGEVIKKNTFLTFGQFNSEDKLIAQTEFSYFNLDPASEYTYENLVVQLSQLINLAKLVTGEDQTIDPVASFKSEAELSKALKESKGCKAIQNEMYEQFEAIVADYLGDNCPLMRIKVITDKSGKYLQLPKDAMFVESMDLPCSLKITAFEYKQQQKSLEAPTATADTIGKAPEKATSKKAILNI